MFLSQIWSYIWDIKLNYSTFNVLTLFFFASLTGLYLFPWIFHQDLDTTHSPWKESKNKKNHHDYWSKIILVKNFQPRGWFSISPSHNHSWIRAITQTKLRITHCQKVLPEFNWLKTHLLASYTDVLNGLSHFLALQTLVGQENLKNP